MASKQEQLWDSRLSSLVDFIHANLKLPSISSNDESERSLKSWIIATKAQYKKGSLDKNRLAKIYEVIPQEFGGDITNSLLNRLIANNDIYILAKSTHPRDENNTEVINNKQLVELLRLGINSREKLISLIGRKAENPGHSDRLADEVLNVLSLSIDDCNFVIPKRENLANIHLATLLNKQLYGIDITTLKLYKAIFGEKICKDKEDLYYFGKYIGLVIKTLTPREEKILRLRFYEKKTLDEVGTEFGVCKDRIRQIEAKVLRKLRHPSRANILKGKSLYQLFTVIAKQEDLKRVLVSKEYADKVGMIEEIANDIRRYSNKAYTTSFILGAAYLGILGSGVELPNIEEKAMMILNKNIKYKQAYIDIFEQGRGITEVDKELTNRFKNRLLNTSIKESTKNTLISEVGLSVRAYNGLARAGFITVGDVMQWVDSQKNNTELFGTDEESIKLKAAYYIANNITNIGKVAANEIVERLYDI